LFDGLPKLPSGAEMNKVDLITKLAEKAQLPKTQSKKVVELFFQALSDGMCNGGRVEVRGLCTFKVKQYGSYTSRNPQNGHPVMVKPKKLPYFKPGIDLKRRVDRP
jgi:integration host factor subunit beta